MFIQLQQFIPVYNLHFISGKLKESIQGKMLIYFITVIALSLHKAVTIDIMPELKKNVLNFGYGANFKYEGMLTHSFDRFYVVAKCEIP